MSQTIEIAQYYNIATDEMKNVTQKWVDDMQNFARATGEMRNKAKELLRQKDDIPPSLARLLQQFLDSWKPELEKK